MATSKLFVTILFLLAFICSCSQSESPALPAQIPRELQSILYKDVIFNPAHANHDMASLRVGPFTDGSAIPDFVSGELALLAGRGWSIAISLENPANDGGTSISLKWLNDNYNIVIPPPGYDQAVEPGLLYQTPKVDAIFYPDPLGEGNGLIEIAVCYLWRNTVIDDWEVGVTITQWSEEAFSSSSVGSYLTRKTINYAIEENWENFSEFNPDISYDTDTGDLYLAYTNLVNNATPYAAQLYYRCLKFGKSETEWLATPQKSLMGSAMHPHDAWQASIDVGRLKAPGLTGNQTNAVAVAYTSHDYNGNGKFQIHVVYWATSNPDQQYSYALPTNGASNNLNAGYPHLDIGPNSAAKEDVGFGAIAYVQAVSTPNEYEVWVVDSFPSATGIFHRIYHPVDNNYLDNQRILPAITCYYAGTVKAHVASVVMLEEQELGGGYHMGIGRIILVDGSITPIWRMLDEPDWIVHGEWNPGYALSFDPSLATGYVRQNGELYWISFCNSLDVNSAIKVNGAVSSAM